MKAKELLENRLKMVKAQRDLAKTYIEQMMIVEGNLNVLVKVLDTPLKCSQDTLRAFRAEIKAINLSSYKIEDEADKAFEIGYPNSSSSFDNMNKQFYVDGFKDAVKTMIDGDNQISVYCANCEQVTGPDRHTGCDQANNPECAWHTMKSPNKSDNPFYSEGSYKDVSNKLELQKINMEIIGSELHNDDKINLLKQSMFGKVMRDNCYKIATQPIAIEFKNRILAIQNEKTN